MSAADGGPPAEANISLIHRGSCVALQLLLLQYPETRKHGSGSRLNRDGEDFPKSRVSLLGTKWAPATRRIMYNLNADNYQFEQEISAFRLFVCHFCSEQQSHLVQLLAGKSSNNGYINNHLTLKPDKSEFGVTFEAAVLRWACETKHQREILTHNLYLKSGEGNSNSGEGLKNTSLGINVEQWREFSKNVKKKIKNSDEKKKPQKTT